MSKVILVSVKPEFAEQILDGTKTIELRKCAPQAKQGDLLVIYGTSPEMAILGCGTIKKIIKQSPSSIWDNHSNQLGIDKHRYFEYYKGRRVAVGIVIGDTKRFELKIPLSKVKETVPAFSPPQTFRYFGLDFLESLDNWK